MITICYLTKKIYRKKTDKALTVGVRKHNLCTAGTTSCASINENYKPILALIAKKSLSGERETIRSVKRRAGTGKRGLRKEFRELGTT
jgi:hypothetical protein